AQQLEQLLVAVDAQPLAPRPSLLDVPFVHGLASGGLHPPSQLVERADLVSEERAGGEVLGHRAHASTSFNLAEAWPRRSTFSLARSVDSISSSLFEETNTVGGWTVSTARRTESTTSCTGSRSDRRPSMAPASRPTDHPVPSEEGSVSTRSTPTASTG